MRMGHEHNGWLVIAEPVRCYCGDDRTLDTERWRMPMRNDPPWQPRLRLRRVCHRCRQLRWAAQQCIYEYTVGNFIANGVAMAGCVGLIVGKEGGDPCIEGNRIGGRNVARRSFARTLGVGTRCRPSGEIAQRSRHRMRPGQTVAPHDWSLEWSQLDTRHDEEETP
ncbi:hypothetical protein IW261DRAFT_1517268 [Armillaria novae-zelandiae]|uniref:Uncharacterized protein n=1 Tax=Armillaria novae-zelandiae TaxID=153914 RepID=A0AA39U1K3_9AGAR|nr:hypothetical protein IW261DRAFT_1517268 [Armillaria novae-zelandiae]